MKFKKEIIKEILENSKFKFLFILFLLVVFRYIILPIFTPIEDITVIVTNSMQHSNYWKINKLRDKCNIPCCLFTNNKSKHLLAIPYQSPSCKIKQIIPIIYNDRIIEILSKIYKYYNGSLNDYIIPTNTTNTTSSFFIYEKVLNYSLLYIKYPKQIPYSDGINPVDIVIVWKVKNPCKEINNYDVIQYEYKGLRLVHRVVMKIPINSSCIFVVRGDNSLYPIPNVEVPLNSSYVKGKVVLRIPYVGLLNYLFYKLFLSNFYEGKINEITRVS